MSCLGHGPMNVKRLDCLQGMNLMRQGLANNFMPSTNLLVRELVYLSMLLSRPNGLHPSNFHNKTFHLLHFLGLRSLIIFCCEEVVLVRQFLQPPQGCLGQGRLHHRARACRGQT